MTMLERAFRLSAVCIIAASCGGGGGGDVAFNGGISGSGVTSGTLDGFGSIILNGRELDTNGATITVDGNSAQESDLRIGQQLVVQANFDTNDADDVDYRSNLKGPVAQVTVPDPTLRQGTVLALGQTIAISADTVFSDVTLTTLVPNDLIEVSGNVDANGLIHATFVERKPSLAEYKVIGTTTNATATTFTLGALLVNYTNATLQGLGSPVRNGVLVEVKAGNTGLNGNTLTASQVELLQEFGFEDGEDADLEGFITSFTSAATFSVAGHAVTTTTNTQFEGGGAASLALNVKVEVDGTANASGVIVASKIEIKHDESVRVEGPITAPVDLVAGTVTALGVRFLVRQGTELEDESNADVDPLTLADLQQGDYVRAEGFVDGGVLVAAEIRRDDADTRARLRGVVSTDNPTNGTVSIEGVTVTGDPAITEFERDGATITQSQFHAEVSAGSVVEARWDDFTATTEPADRLSIEDDD